VVGGAVTGGTVVVGGAVAGGTVVIGGAAVVGIVVETVALRGRCPRLRATGLKPCAPTIESSAGPQAAVRIATNVMALQRRGRRVEHGITSRPLIFALYARNTAQIRYRHHVA